MTRRVPLGATEALQLDLTSFDYADIWIDVSLDDLAAGIERNAFPTDAVAFVATDGARKLSASVGTNFDNDGGMRRVV